MALCYTYHSSGQHAELADLGGPVLRGTVGASSPISDDGQESDALLPAQHLVISFTGSGIGDRTVEVLDDQGRAVLVQHAPSHAGRTLIPVDVTGLAKGRYAVRVQEGGATRISRFVRE
jgi:hypothetical protein